MDYHTHSILTLQQEREMQKQKLIEHEKAVEKIEERRRQEKKKLQDQEETEFQNSASHFLRKKIDTLDQRVEHLEDIVSQLVVILEKNTEDKIALATIYNTVHAFKKAGHLKEILLKEGKNYFDTNTSLHHHFYDVINNELTDIDNNKIELKKFPTPPRGKSIKNVNVIINIDNDNQNH